MRESFSQSKPLKTTAITANKIGNQNVSGLRDEAATCAGSGAGEGWGAGAEAAVAGPLMSLVVSELM
jgi:hypothetical protein